MRYIIYINRYINSYWLYDLGINIYFEWSTHYTLMSNEYWSLTMHTKKMSNNILNWLEVSFKFPMLIYCQSNYLKMDI